MTKANSEVESGSMDDLAARMSGAMVNAGVAPDIAQRAVTAALLAVAEHHVVTPRLMTEMQKTASRRYWRDTKHPRGPGLYNAILSVADYSFTQWLRGQK